METIKYSLQSPFPLGGDTKRPFIKKIRHLNFQPSRGKKNQKCAGGCNPCSEAAGGN